MLNLNELENRWLHYKIKSYIPHAIIGFLAITIAIAISSINFSKEESKKTIQKEVLKESKKTEKPILKETKVIKKVIVKSGTTEQNEKLLITPSLKFLRNIQNDSQEYYNEEVIVKKEKKIVQEQIVPKPQVEEITPEEEVVKHNTIDITRQNTQEDIQHVIKRFKKSNNPALSLFVAKKYYELGEYNRAYNYALITNELNNNIEDSWIVFSKSLVKLGKKEKAIEILNKYVNNSHSSRAKILLDNIKSGKLK
ncbi:CDC27 family protein [Sulfurimonas sp.]